MLLYFASAEEKIIIELLANDLSLLPSSLLRKRKRLQKTDFKSPGGGGGDCLAVGGGPSSLQERVFCIEFPLEKKKSLALNLAPPLLLFLLSLSMLLYLLP